MGSTIRCAAYLDKGGTGKTTSVGHFGVALAEAGRDVLLIDLAGKQGDLSKLFGLRDAVDPDDWPNIATTFQPEWERVAEKLGDSAVNDLIYATDESVDLIPAHQGLDSLDVELESKYDGQQKYTVFDQFLTEFIDQRYDVVLLDLPGAANNITYNGVYAAEQVLTPVETGHFEAEQARALVGDLNRFQDAVGREVGLAMLLPNKVDQRTKLAQRYLEEYTTEFGELIAPEPIPDSQAIRNAAANGQTVFAYEEPSKTAQRAQEAFQADADALVDRINDVVVSNV
jgi:chromosome partitioning protein